MKKAIKLLLLVLAMMLAAAPAMAACATANANAVNNCKGDSCTAASSCSWKSCTTNSCSGGVDCANVSTCPSASKKPSATATVKPTATPKPTATAKPTATVKPTATPAPTSSGNSGTSLSSMASEVVSQTNAERAKQGLGSLTVSSELTRAACVRAQEIVTKFSHTRPDGSAWSTVSSSAYGENIAMGQQSADKVMAAWMSSSGHRANILRSSFGSIGVCAYKVGNTMYWVQLFGK